MIVTALIYQPGGRLTRSLAQYLQSLELLANATDHLVLFLDHRIAAPTLPMHVEVRRISIHDLKIAQRISPHADLVELPGQRNLVKDTIDYLILVNAKTELLEQALLAHPDVKRAAWVDCGIGHVLKDPLVALKQLDRLQHLPDGLTLPGILTKPLWPGDGVCWRFCGGVVAGDRLSLLRLYDLHRQAIDALWPKLTLEVNVWAWMEMQGSIGAGSPTPLHWYAADHNESMLNLPVAPPQASVPSTVPPKVALNMIVRNEAAIIERALASVLGHVHACIICDTGSTDDTVARIQNFCQRHGLTCEIHHTVFENFSQARNLALDCARRSALEFDYLLLMDADMQLQCHEPQALAGLNAPAALLTQDTGVISYPNVRLLSRHAQATYTGATHEVLCVEGDVARLSGWTFIDHADGGTRPEKFERDERLLRQELLAQPQHLRTLFYLAQTLRDKGDPAAAIPVYQSRMAAGGWDEETWYCAYQIAVCHHRLGQSAEMAQACLSAYSLRPTRAEPLVLLAKALAQQAQHDAAMLFLEQALNIEWPAKDQLFVEHQAYGDAVREFISISGFYSTQPHRQAKGQQLCEALALDADVESGRRALARRNLFFYARAWLEWAPDTSSHRLQFSAGESWALTNPSFVAHADGYCGIVRGVNYRLDKNTYSVLDPQGIIRTRNHWVELDAQLRVRSWHAMDDLSALPRHEQCRIRGFEDCRPFFRQGQWWASATARDVTSDYRASMVLLRLNEQHHFDQAQPLHGFGDQLHQKNWMPLPGDNMRWLYSCSPAFVVQADPDTGFILVESGHVPARACEHWRGGGHMVVWDGGWLGMVHETLNAPEGRQYLHRWILTDEQGVVQRHSLPFYFFKPGIEFVAGLTWGAMGPEELLVSVGVRDCEAWLVRVKKSDIARCLQV